MIKLYYLGEYPANIKRYCTQLGVGKNAASFIMEDGVMKEYKKGSFIPYEKEFEIVNSKEDMNIEQL